jgi:hypoxanthine-DNA glycosylase
MVPELLYGLAPIVGGSPHTLILGNMPSVKSLAAQQYYGNPRNAFWRIAGDIFDFDTAAPYETRTTMLTTHGIALWDVLRCCRRSGSLDSAVEPESMVANDFGRLFERQPSITRVPEWRGGGEKLQPTGPRRTRDSVPTAAVDQSGADHAVCRQAGGLARSHHRMFVTVRRRS